MKKIMAVLLAAAILAGAAPNSAVAGGGHHGWSTAGKIMTGIIGLHILGNVIANSQPQPVYVPERRSYDPEPRYYAPPRDRVWIEGRYETRIERQWVPGRWDVSRDRGDVVDDEFGDDDRGAPRRAWIPGHYRTIERQVWIDGHWEERG